MILPPFTLHQPESIQQALKCALDLGTAAESYEFMGGGTDLLPNFLRRLNPTAHVISLANVESLLSLSAASIGASVTLADVARSQVGLPAVLKETAKLIAGPAIREAATVGGNLLLGGRCVYYNQSELCRTAKGACMKAEGSECIVVPQTEHCYSVSSGDLAPVLMVLGASVKIVGPSGERVLSVSEFYRSDGIDSHELRPGEILSEVLLPQAAAELRVRYWKLRPRSAMDFPEAGVAVAVNADASGELRVALGALGSRPIGLVKSTAEIDATQPLELANRLWRELKPQTDTVRNSVFRPYYRKEMARLQLGKLLQELL